jgi:iron(III) transport system permease protein
MRRRFDELLGKRTPQFLSSLVTLINADVSLQKAFREAPMTVVQAALKAATFDLPIEPSLGYAYIVAFNNLGRTADGTVIRLTGTASIIIISMIIRKMPYTVRSGSAFLMQMDPSIEEASINLGVSPMKTFAKVTVRMMLPGVLSGAIISWVTCINELSTSIMLYTGKTATITVASYTAIVRNSVGTGAALASILTLTSGALLLIFFKVSKGKVSIV